MAKRIVHPNIVPLLGAIIDPLLGAIIDPLELISDWMPGGDLTTYITNCPTVDRHSLVCPPPCGTTQQTNPLISYLMWLKDSGIYIPVI